MSVSSLLEFLRRELVPTSGRGSATFRLTLACLAATIPIFTHRIPLGLIVMILMYLITQEDTAAMFLNSISLRRIVSQARPDDRRAGLRHRFTGGSRDDPSRYSPAEPGSADRICAVALVVRHAWTFG